MKISVTTKDPATLSTDCLVVGITPEQPLGGSVAAINRATKGLIKRLLDPVSYTHLTLPTKA